MLSLKPPTGLQCLHKLPRHPPLRHRPTIAALVTRPHRQPPSVRQFVTPPWSEPETQTLTASRTLSYPASALYDIVADVEAYSTFLPYCRGSRVTRWSDVDETHGGRRWPHEAEIRVGWSGYEEVIVSEVFCQAPYVIEAVIGDARKTIPDADLPHYHLPSSPSSSSSSSTQPPSQDPHPSRAKDTTLLQSLYTRWTLRPFPYKPPAHADNPLHGEAKAPAHEQTDVSLEIRFQFANPIYTAMSKAVAPKVASAMVEAFARRVRDVLGEPGVGPLGVDSARGKGGESMGAEEGKGSTIF